MPKIVGKTTHTSAATLELDSGPILYFRAWDEPVGDAFHWHLGDFKWTLLDLTVRRSDGAVIGVTLTLFRGPVLDRAPTAFDRAMRIEGLPTVDSIEPIGAVLRERTELSVHLGSEMLYIVLDDHGQDLSCYVSSYARFFVAEGRLTGLAFGPLTKAQRSRLAEVLESNR